MTHHNEESSRPPEHGPTKRPWEPMKVAYVGQIADVVQSGGGKLTAPTGDPGEPFRKPPGQL